MNKRSDGRYREKIYLGTENGKPKYKYIEGKNKADVEKRAREFRNALDKRLDVDGKYTFKDCVNLLLESKKASISESDFKTLKFRLSPFVSELGYKNIKDVRKAEIEPILRDLAADNPTTGKPSAQRTTERYLTAVSSVFENAIENRLIEFNPCKNIKPPKGEKHQRRALTDQERKWIEETPGRGQLIGMIGMYAGLRKGEMAALLWSDIDLRNKTITVDKSYDLRTGRIKSPKTAAGVRLVSIPQKLVDYLKSQPRPCQYVIHTIDNHKMTLSGFQKCWESYIRELDLKYGAGKKPKKYAPEKHYITIQPFTIHELRHTFCTLMYLSGVDILTAQQQMGHADVKTTLGIYSHLDALYKKKNISKLDDFLK